MGLLGRFLGGFFSNGSSNEKDCDWYCDECDAYLNAQSGFTAVSGEWTCTECGCVNDVSEDNIISSIDEYSYSDHENEDEDIPEGCRACGGPYPNCTDSCPLFDD